MLRQSNGSSKRPSRSVAHKTVLLWFNDGVNFLRVLAKQPSRSMAAGSFLATLQVAANTKWNITHLLLVHAALGENEFVRFDGALWANELVMKSHNQ